MRRHQIEQAGPQGGGAASCRCAGPEPEDPELRALFHDLARTLIELMDPADADIVVRTELQGQTTRQIATQIGCSQAEAVQRVKHAQKCFCRIAALSLAPGNSR